VGQGFGIRSLKKQESHESKIAQTNYIKHLIIGDDLSSFMLALKLYRLEQPFQIILENDVTLEMLKGKWAATFPTLRDELVYQELIQAHPALQNEQHWHSSEFYKDSKFHQFSGRVKHFEMKSSEPGFMQASKRIDYLALFTADDDNQLSAILKNNCAKKIMVEINKTTPLDLVEPNNYEVEFTDYSKIKCEHLYFARNPKLFFKLLKNILGLWNLFDCFGF
jgi:hypothetical protein